MCFMLWRFWVLLTSLNCYWHVYTPSRTLCFLTPARWKFSNTGKRKTAHSFRTAFSCWLSLDWPYIGIHSHMTLDTARSALSSFNPFTAPACKISGPIDWHRSAQKTDVTQKQCMFQSDNSSVFSAMHLDKILSHANAKNKRFQIISHHYWSFLSGIIALKGLKPLKRLKTFFFSQPYFRSAIWIPTEFLLRHCGVRAACVCFKFPPYNT